MHKIVDVKVGAGYILSIVFDDGVQGTVDLTLPGKAFLPAGWTEAFLSQFALVHRANLFGDIR